MDPDLDPWSPYVNQARRFPGSPLSVDETCRGEPGQLGRTLTDGIVAGYVDHLVEISQTYPVGFFMTIPIPVLLHFFLTIVCFGQNALVPANGHHKPREAETILTLT